MSKGFGCKRHGIGLKKTRNFQGEIVYVCPKDKCGYKVDKEGEKI